jgi:hypothetical protein
MTDVVQIVVGLAVGWRALVVINDMTQATPHCMRCLQVALGTMGAWIALAPFFPDQPGDVPKLVALVIYLMIEMLTRRGVRAA